MVIVPGNCMIVTDCSVDYINGLTYPIQELEGRCCLYLKEHSTKLVVNILLM